LVLKSDVNFLLLLIHVNLRVHHLIPLSKFWGVLYNGIAERVNGILKDEQGLEKKFGSFGEAWEKVQEAIEIYNYERPHGSIDYLPPAEAHKMSGPIPKRWKYWHRRKGRQDVPA
jgi:hypothetical protein